jgi:hypothetical protein
MLCSLSSWYSPSPACILLKKSEFEQSKKTPPDSEGVQFTKFGRITRIAAYPRSHLPTLVLTRSGIRVCIIVGMHSQLALLQLPRGLFNCTITSSYIPYYNKRAAYVYSFPQYTRPSLPIRRRPQPGWLGLRSSRHRYLNIVYSLIRCSIFEGSIFCAIMKLTS